MYWKSAYYWILQLRRYMYGYNITNVVSDEEETNPNLALLSLS